MRRALHDPLTGLSNRALLLDRMWEALTRLERHSETVAVYFVDMDGFKAVNDTWCSVMGCRRKCPSAPARSGNAWPPSWRNPWPSVTRRLPSGPASESAVTECAIQEPEELLAADTAMYEAKRTRNGQTRARQILRMKPRGRLGQLNRR